MTTVVNPALAEIDADLRIATQRLRAAQAAVKHSPTAANVELLYRVRLGHDALLDQRSEVRRRQARA